ncbi:helix-turn-helix domain-containing protein, partial [Citrobacter freundii]
AESTLRNVFRHHWPKGEKIIADFLNMEPSEIWPSRYQNLTVKEVA